jgi:proline dehydrogenase
MVLNLHRGVISLANLPQVEHRVNHTPAVRKMVSRFIAGDDLQDALRVASDLQRRGIDSALDLLGENVTHEDEARQATDAYIGVLAGAVEAGVKSPYVSVKLTALGLDISEDLAEENLRRILTAAANTPVPAGDGRKPAFVRVDMEGSAYTEVTLRIVRSAHEDFKNVGAVLQSYLYRTDTDIEDMIEHQIPVRLVKGAYAEPVSVAYAKKRDVDAAYRRHLAQLLVSRHPTAVATHDPEMIRTAKRITRERRLDNEWVEFQMLLGIRSDLRDDLASEGYNVRAYIPFGSQWYPYFVRRLAERPANLLFVLKNLK